MFYKLVGCQTHNLKKFYYSQVSKIKTHSYTPGMHVAIGGKCLSSAVPFNKFTDNRVEWNDAAM